MDIKTPVVKFFRRNLHLIVFWTLMAAFLKLQFSGPRFGWPIPTISILNLLPGVLVIGLAMLPFGADDQRPLTIGKLISFTLAAAIVARHVVVSGGKPMFSWSVHDLNYTDFDRTLIYFLCLMMLNGVFSYVWRLAADFIDWPSS